MFRYLLAIIAACGAICSAAELMTFNNNGAWCWYQDERVIIHDNKLIMGSVACGSGTGGSSRNGNIEVTTYDLVNGGSPSTFVLHANLQSDDHDLPAFLAMPDGKILAMYTRHLSDYYIRYRITTNPNDTSAWDSEVILTREASTSYSNIFRLSGENGRIYDFYRGENFNPNYIISDDNGQSWSYGGHLIRKDNHRPYVKYCSNNVDKVHFITTEGHPRDYNNSVYHGYIYNGGIYKTDGTKLGDLADGPVAPESLTKLHDGSAESVGWTTDIHLDENENPVVAFTSQVDGVGLDIRYFYGRWDGSNWHINEMCYGGTRLYSGEDDYSGLIAIDPQDVTTVYISVNVNPYNGEPLISSADNQQHWEIFRGTTADMGASWEWKPITLNSTDDNIRPIVPIWDGDYTILLWNKGTYTTYTNFDMDVVGMFGPEPIADGAPFVMQSPVSAAAAIGDTVTFTAAADSDTPVSYQWHLVAGGVDTEVGTNSAELVIEDVDSGDFGSYYCVMSNEYGSAVTSSATLVQAQMFAWWKFEGNLTDSSGNGKVASAVNGPTLSSDAAAGEYSVSLGGGSYINCGTDTDYQLVEAGTVCGWVKTSSLTNPWASIVGKGRSAWRLCRYNSDATVAFHINTASGSEVQANGSVTVVDGQWHHVAGTWSGQKVTLYVDGEIDAQVSSSDSVNATADPMWIGGRSDSTSRYWDGLIDDVRIYSYALSEAEIKDIMAGDTGCSEYSYADYDRDCKVDIADFEVLCQNWLECNIVPEEYCW